MRFSMRGARTGEPLRWLASACFHSLHSASPLFSFGVAGSTATLQVCSVSSALPACRLFWPLQALHIPICRLAFSLRGARSCSCVGWIFRQCRTRYFSGFSLHSLCYRNSPHCCFCPLVGSRLSFVG